MKTLKIDMIRTFRVCTLMLLDIILINLSVIFSLFLRHECSMAMPCMCKGI